MRALAIAAILVAGTTARADVSAGPPSSTNGCPKGPRMRAIFDPRPRPAGAAAASIPVARARAIVLEELALAKLTPSAEPLALAGLERVDELRRYYPRELREKQKNLPLHTTELLTRPVHLDAFVPERGVGLLVLGAYLELAVHRSLLRTDRGSTSTDHWQRDVRARLLRAADGEPRLHALFLLGDPGYDREDELRRLIREALTCLPPSR